MSVFQIVALSAIGVLFLVSVWQLVRGRARKWFSLVWLMVWICAGAAVAMPNATTGIAHFLGIVRGADLVFYCAVIAGLAGFFLVYLSVRRLNRQLTEITRQVALNAARKQAPDSPEPRKISESDLV